MAAAKEVRRDTDTQSEIVTTMRTSMILGLEAWFFHALPTASSGQEGISTNRPFLQLAYCSYCCTKFTMGGKVVHLIKRRRWALFIKIALDALGACRTHKLYTSGREGLDEKPPVGPC